MPTIEELRLRGDIGGRTVQIVSSGAVEVAVHEPVPLPAGQVRVRTVRSAISPGTEMTFYGRDASNVYLHKRWNEELRLFEAAEPTLQYPIAFGYRAAGLVVDGGTTDVPLGLRVYGNWRHTEFTVLPEEAVRAQQVPDALTWDDAIDLGQMAPICVNAVAFAEGEHQGGRVVVFGAGPIGLITAQVARAGGATVGVVDRIPQRLEIAEGLGFETLSTAEVNVAAALKGRFGADGIAVAWECTGSTYVLNEAIRTVRRQGLVVAVGFYQGEGAGLLLGDEFHHNGIRIVCGQIGNVHRSTSRDALRRSAIELALSGRLSLGALPRATLPVEDVADAFVALTRPAEVFQVALDYGTETAGH